MNSCSVPAGRGPALARRTSSKGNQTEFFLSFPLRRIQVYGQNIPFRNVRSSPPLRCSGLGLIGTFTSAPRGVKMTLHGPSYPSSTTLEPTPQAFVLNLLCATEASEPEFKSYDGAQAVVEWSAPSGCGFRGDSSTDEDSNTPEKEVESVGSGIGWFFLLFVFLLLTKHGEFLTRVTLRLFISFAGYFALGAYYNYTTYGATGVDLIPCVFSLRPMAPILKHSSLAVGIETFGARYHICFETLSRTFVVLSNHGTAPVGEDISRYNSWFHAIFPWIILHDGVNKVDCSATSFLGTARRTCPYHNRYLPRL